MGGRGGHSIMRASISLESEYKNHLQDNSREGGGRRPPCLTHAFGRSKSEGAAQREEIKLKKMKGAITRHHSGLSFHTHGIDIEEHVQGFCPPSLYYFEENGKFGNDLNARSLQLRRIKRSVG